MSEKACYVLWRNLLQIRITSEYELSMAPIKLLKVVQGDQHFCCYDRKQVLGMVVDECKFCIIIIADQPIEKYVIQKSAVY